MYVQRAHVRACLAFHKRDACKGEQYSQTLLFLPRTHIALWIILEQLVLIDRAYAQLSLDSRDEWRPLVECASELVKTLEMVSNMIYAFTK